MISAIRDLGLLVLKRAGKDVLGTLTQKINDKKYSTMLVVKIGGDSPFNFDSIDLEGMNSVGADMYLYRKGPPNGCNFSPTALITEPEKTYHVKVLGWFKTIDKLDLCAGNRKFFQCIKEILESRQTEIVASIKGKMSELKGDAGITLKIGERYLMEIPAFREVFLQLYSAKEESIFAEEKICSVCCGRKAKVFAGAPAYSFFTYDKPGFITGNFVLENSWRNYPVCFECSLAVDEGKRILENNLKFSFYGLSYYLIPKFMLGEPSHEIVGLLAGDFDKDIRLTRSAGLKLTNYEDDILDLLAQKQDTMTLNFFFLQRQQGAERILLLIDDIFPSRLRKLFEAKAVVDKKFTGQPFHIGRIRTFFSKSDAGKKENDLDKYFLGIINSIFKGIPVSQPFLTTHFMREIRRDFNEGNVNSFKVLDAMETVEFFTQLGILEFKEVKMESTIFDSVFEKYGAQLDSPEKRGIFLLGTLTRMLLNIQYRERKSQPFLSQLMGLKMDERSLRGLLPKTVNKLQEYDRFENDKGKKKLAEVISRYFMESSPHWRMTVDELNFYFVCGMNLYNEINEILYGNKEEESEDDSM